MTPLNLAARIADRALERPTPYLVGAALLAGLVTVALFAFVHPLLVAAAVSVAMVVPFIFARVVRILALLVVALMVTEVPRNRFEHIPLVYDDLIAIILMGAAAVQVVRARLDRGDLSWPRRAYAWVWVPLVAWTLFTAVSGLVNGNQFSIWRTELIYVLLYATFFLALEGLERRSDFRLLFWAFIAAMGGITIEYASEAIFQAAAGIPQARVISQQANLVVVAAAFLMPLYLTTRRRAALCLIGFVPLIIIALLSQQRAIFVALPAALLTSAAVATRSTAVRPRRLMGFAAGLVVAGVLGWLVASSFTLVPKHPSVGRGVASRVEEVASGGSVASMAIRFVSYAHVWREKISERPIVGWGLGDEASVPILRGGGFKTLRVDNAYLTLWWKSGLVGLVLFLGLYGAGIWRALRFVRHPHPEIQVLAIGVAGALVGILVLSLASVLITHYRFNALWGILLALLPAAERVYFRARAADG